MNPMTRIVPIFLACAILAQAHFSFVVPQAGGRRAELMISEDLSPSPGVSIDILQGAKLFLRSADGKDTALTLVKTGNTYGVDLPGKGNRIVHGFADLGVSPGARGPKPYLLLYYPKTILGDAFASTNRLDAERPVELVPKGQPGRIAFLLLAKGEPVANAEVTVILPSGEQKRVKTNEQGVTPEFDQSGRYGAWARYWEAGRGERGGKPYEEIRHYATLVVDSFGKLLSRGELPEATSSFGAVATGEYLYVYGGHVSPTHTYSTASVSGQFHRMNLKSRKWEALASGPGLQGMNLVAHGGKIYRVGGMEPRNAPGEKQRIDSVATVAAFDEKTGSWQDLPPLPEARSSHDVVVIGSQLIVTGGWKLDSAGGDVWSKKSFRLNLADPSPQWTEFEQPFERRAFITAVHDGKMYVMGGITPKGAVAADVDVYDPTTGEWTKGPMLPGTATENFAPAACEHEGRLLVSLANGALFELEAKTKQWRQIGVGTARLAHRMVSTPGAVLILGGAIRGENLKLVEEFMPVDGR